MAFLFVVSGCATTPDFRGLRMPSESHAEDLISAGLTRDIFKISTEKVSASANIEYFTGEIIGFWITLNNQSNKAIVTKQLFADYTLITRDGDRVGLLPPTVSYNPVSEVLGPKSSTTFQIRLGRPKVTREEIKMIICSLDLGKTKVYLFPNPEKARPTLQ